MLIKSPWSAGMQLSQAQRQVPSALHAAMAAAPLRASSDSGIYAAAIAAATAVPSAQWRQGASEDLQMCHTLPHGQTGLQRVPLSDLSSMWPICRGQTWRQNRQDRIKHRQGFEVRVCFLVASVVAYRQHVQRRWMST